MEEARELLAPALVLGTSCLDSGSCMLSCTDSFTGSGPALIVGGPGIPGTILVPPVSGIVAVRRSWAGSTRALDWCGLPGTFTFASPFRGLRHDDHDKTLYWALAASLPDLLHEF